MTDHLQLIRTRLEHLARMREYLAYSLGRILKILPIEDWKALSSEQHESLAAFRVRFSEFQEHLGKTMRAVAPALLAQARTLLNNIEARRHG